MSAINGDKGRHDRQRKKKMHNREKMREIRASLNPKADKASASKAK